jgi:hypothetical protein
MFINYLLHKNSLKLPVYMGLYSKNIRLIKKTILFKFKILIKVIFKYKLQSQQVERI